jgi:hypothetical protein
MNSATVSSNMTKDTQKQKPPSSRLLAGFGTVKPRHKPEDYRLVREEMEVAMAEEVAEEVTKPNAGE